MANHDLYFPKMLKWAGGYVKDKDDKGGATKYDVTLGTWRALMGKSGDKDDDGDVDAEDIKLLTLDDAKLINRKFWNDCQGDKITSQSVAESLVEWYWGSGKTGIKKVQRIVGVEPDGKVGVHTISAINSCDARGLFEQIRLAKIQFVNAIVVHDPTQKKFLKGWLNRINDFKFTN